MGSKRGCIVLNRSLYALTLIFCTISALGQDQTIGLNGEGSFIPGPQGVPILVLNDGDVWTQPLVVFKNSDIEIIIPDIRTSNWAALYAVAFKKEGTYPMPFYIYGIKSHRTMRELLYVNTRTKVAVVVTNGLTPPDRYDLCKPDPSMPIDRITSIVEDVSNKFHGQTVDEAIVIQEYFLAQQADCVHNDPDCNLSGADYRIKHPRSPSPKTPTQVLLAQIAQFTARAPKDSCKAAPNTSARHNPVPPLAADITLTRVAMLPEHIVFHEDSIVVGHQDPFEDDLYVVANVRVINRLKVPLHLNDITVVLTAPDDTQTTAAAANKEDLPNLYATFPALKPFVSDPILRGTVLQPAGETSGMVLFTFPITQAVWDQSKYAVISFDFINQTPVNVIIPKPTQPAQSQSESTSADNNMPNFGIGSGIGSGSGGGYGGGARQIGGGVIGPKIIYQPEPEFSEEARKAKFNGAVLVGLIVDQNGTPQNVHVIRGVGMGLDEKAMEAVRQYRFKPGTENGKPVATFLNVEINFQSDPATPASPIKEQTQDSEADVQTGEATGHNIAMSTVQTRAGTFNIGTDTAFGTRFATYVQQITQKVAAQWYTGMLDPQAAGHRVYITFQVERDGSLTHIVLAQPSRDPTLDSTALNAVRHIDTFGPVPDAYSGSHINVTYYFDPPPHSAAPAISANGTIMVQIAVVSSQNVADILLASLQKKGYSVIVRHEPQDKLLHVEIGPFATQQDAEAMQQRLLADGFNAIVK